MSRPTNDTRPPRAQSLVIAHFPWYTGEISAQRRLGPHLESGHLFAQFLNDLEKFENYIFSNSLDSNISTFRRAIGYSDHPLAQASVADSTPDPVSLPDKTTSSRACSILSAYRLAELVIMREGNVRRVPTIPRPRSPFPLPKFPAWVQLKDWPSMLLRTKALFLNRQHKSLLGSSASTSQNGHIILLKRLVDLTSHNKTGKVLINFLVAAIHLSLMLKRPRQLSGVPDYLDGIEGLMAINYSSSSSAELHEADWLETSERKILDNYLYGDPIMARLPLQMALLISPICLLIPMQLAQKNTWARESLFKTAHALGNQKPALLLNIEKVVWEYLLQVATLQLDINEGVEKLIEVLPWGDLEMLEDSDAMRHWFKADQPVELAAGPILPIEAMVSTNIAAQSHSRCVGGGEDRPEHGGRVGDSDIISIHIDKDQQRITNVDKDSIPTPTNGKGIETVGVVEAYEGIEDAEEIEDADNIEEIEAADEIDNAQGCKQGDCEPVPGHQEVISNEGRLGMEALNDENREGGRGKFEGQLMDVHMDVNWEEEFHEADSQTVDTENDNNGKTEEIEWVSQAINAQNDDNGEEEECEAGRQLMDAQTDINPEREDREVGSEADGKAESDANSQVEDTQKDKNGEGDETEAVSQVIDRQNDGIGKGKESETTSRKPSGLGQKRKQSGRLPNPRKKPRIPKLKPVPMVDLTPWMADVFEAKKEINLDISNTAVTLIGSSITAYGPHLGDETVFQPLSHDQQDLSRLVEFQKAIEGNFIEGKPRHLKDPDSSVFRVITEEVYLSSTPRKIQEILRTHCIVVTNRTEKALSFDERGLRTLGALHKVVTVQDLSIPIADYGNQRTREGTMRQILECSKQENGKIINALHFPRGRTAYDHELSEHIATEASAWESTEGDIACKEDVRLPIGDMRWGLLALKGALHWVHIDSDGYGTFNDVKCGSKYWMVLKPRKSQKELARIGIFYDPNFELDCPGSEVFDIEAMLLAPGTTLIMPPNTPHAVYTPDNTICWGGHYYATGTMQATFTGLVHAFMAGKYITNTNHPVSRLLLQRILCFYYQALVVGEIDDSDDLWQHVPSFNTIDSALDFLSLCALGYMGNALDGETYTLAGQYGAKMTEAERQEWFKNDVNSMSLVNRRRCTYVRGIAAELIRWFSKNWDVYILPGAHGLQGLPGNTGNFAMNYIGEQLVKVKAYKKMADEQEPLMNGVPSCTLDMFICQIDGCYSARNVSENFVPLTNTAVAGDFLGFTQDKTWFRIKAKFVGNQIPVTAKSYAELSKIGESRRDALYYGHM